MKVMPRFSARRALGVLWGLGAILSACFVLALSWGETPISVLRAWNEHSVDGQILFQVRLPRVVLAALVGASLAASGAALQALFRNPLADPFVLGVSGGAALGATLAMALGLGAWSVGVFWSVSATSLFALTGAFFSTLGVLWLGRWAGKSVDSTLLAGVVWNSVALAAITLLKVLWAPDKLGELLYWMAGNLGHEPPATLGVAALLQGVALSVLWALSGRLNVLSLGDEDAATLGVSVDATRRWILLAVSLSVGVSVSLAGLVGFVGLMVPHVLRLWLGPDQRLLIPASALGGASFLILADAATRVLFQVFQAQPPVGVLTSTLGGLFFLALLYRTKRTSLIRNLNS